ncbi:MAG: alpha-galactosidase [Ruminococcus sp.]|nr:alpha-galactosidase [Ruminococcus sp.]
MLKLKNISFAYMENDELFHVNTVRSVSNDRMKLEINSEENILTVNVNTSNELRIQHISAVFEYPFSTPEKIFLNGYQSWTDSIEHELEDTMKGIDHIPEIVKDKYAFSQYGDYNFANYSSYPGNMHGWTYGYVRYTNEFDFFGSLAEKTGFTQIIVSVETNEIYFIKDCEDLTVNGNYCGLKIFMRTGDEDTVFDKYFELLNIKPSPDVKPIYGYTSWYRHYQKISEKLLLEELDGITDQRYKADVFQIDDGWQTAVGDWLSVDKEKFPNGMKSIADFIKDRDMMAGLWLAPFVCETDSVIFRTKEHWLLKDESFQYVKAGSNWSGFYALDIYNEEFREYLRGLFDTVINEWGFKLLKLDFLYAACICPREFKTRGQVMADAMSFLREITKGALILGCGVQLGSAFGMVDYCRIGCDVSLDWNDKPHMRLMHRERISTKNSVLNSVFRRQLNGRAFYNDPDVFILRDEDTTLTHAQKQCLSEVNAMMGGVLFTSDNVSEYDETTQKILSKVMALRNCKVISAELIGEFLIVKFSIGDRKFLRKYKV